jgi:2',3'-cyclic-nucleotide 2'-phosphodiesterase (5'-nucleotidase family)
MGNVVKNKIVLSGKEQLKTLGEVELKFENGKIITLDNYLKMIIDLSQCGVKSSLILTFETE